MYLERWDPVRDLMTISNQLSRLATDSQSRFGDDDTYGAWVPPTDVFERDDKLVLRAELPGVSREDIDIRVENGLLTLHGQRKRESELNEENAYRLERSYGSFTRSFRLPTTVDSTKIEASFKDGVLEIVLPKAEEAKSKRVEIKTA